MQAEGIVSRMVKGTTSASSLTIRLATSRRRIPMSSVQQLIKCVALCHGADRNLLLRNPSMTEVAIDGVPILCGVIATYAKGFDDKAFDNRFNVRVKIKAFSCNYRDKAFLFAALQRGVENSFYPVGSEFMGEVVDVGSEVHGFNPGDRVIGDNWFRGFIPNSGIPTNHASRELQVFHYKKIIKIPERMPDTVAAAFSIGSQTAYGMIRRLQLFKGANILITAAKSNTSLFVINALRNLDVNLYVTTTSELFEKRFARIGIKELIKLDSRQRDFNGYERLKEIAKDIGGFNYVIDPFFDLHLAMFLAVEIIAFEGKYITCGLANQYDPLQTTNHRNDVGLNNIFTQSIVNNYQLIGNCLGLTEDLSQALHDYEQGLFDVIIDSVHKDDQVGAFFSRTFNSRERFGKVVYQY